jgi:putative transposase
VKLLPSGGRVRVQPRDRFQSNEIENILLTKPIDRNYFSYMKRTIAIKLKPTEDQSGKLANLQQEFAKACNLIVPSAIEHRCWNRVALHHMTYYSIREATKLGSQMTCNAIFSVCKAYKALKIKKKDNIPVINFKKTASVHFDKKTYTFKKGLLSLYTLTGRINVEYILGDFQKKYLENYSAKEAELKCKRGQWYLNLVLDTPYPKPKEKTGKVLGIDLGENNIASISSGKIFGGGNLRHKRDKHLNLRSRLQSNGSKSAIQLLQKISGKEARYVSQVNHTIAKEIIKEALAMNVDTIVMEKLTNIRKRIKGGKRLRSRLHRWSWYQLQSYIEYKAKVGLRVQYVNPAYTSSTCHQCDELGIRKKHLFYCKACQSKIHADLNASLNLSTLAVP